MRLRNCSADVDYGTYTIVDDVTGEVMNIEGYMLTSYATPVCLYDVHSEIIYLLAHWDCSITTHSHVRKFVEDYVGVWHNAAKARKEMARYGYYRAAHLA